MKTFAIFVAILALLGCQPSASNGSDPVATPSTPPVGATQKFVVKVDNGFSPDSIEVKAGTPVEITFDTINRSCATEVVFKDLDIKAKLTDGEKTVLAFTPKSPGTYEYACPMDMLKGKVVAK